MVRAIPEGYHTVTPYLVVKGAKKAIAFYEKAFLAEFLSGCDWPDAEGALMHAEMKIGDSIVMISDPSPTGEECPPTFTILHLYVQDVDASFKRAVDCGAKVICPVSDMFWGDRYGQVEDPFGNRWAISTHKEELSVDEMNERAAEFFKKK